MQQAAAAAVANTAYDLDTFAPRSQHQRLRVAQTPKKRVFLRRWRWVWAVALGGVLLALVISMLFSQAQATALAEQIRSRQTDLEDLQSEYTYLSNEMEMKTNLADVEQYAVNNLRMVKMDRSQITYVTAGQENTVQRSETGLARLADGISQTMASFMEYLTP